MRKILLLSSALLLASCTETLPDVSSLVSSEVTSASSEPSIQSDSSSSTSVTDPAPFEEAIKDVNAVEGHPISLTVHQEEALSYLTDASPLTIEGTDDFTMARYHVNDGMVDELVQRLGTSKVGENETKYESQSFCDATYAYVLTSMDDGTKNKQMAPYSEATKQSLLNLNFVVTFEQNVRFVMSYLNQSRFLVEYDLGKRMTGDGVYSYSFKITQYVSDTSRVPELSQGHAYEVTVSNGIITTTKDTYEYVAYGGGGKANWRTSVSHVTYTQGDEYPLFEGTRFDPKDFKLETN